MLGSDTRDRGVLHGHQCMKPGVASPQACLLTTAGTLTAGKRAGGVIHDGARRAAALGGRHRRPAVVCSECVKVGVLLGAAACVGGGLWVRVWGVVSPRLLHLCACRALTLLIYSPMTQLQQGLHAQSVEPVPTSNRFSADASPWPATSCAVRVLGEQLENHN